MKTRLLKAATLSVAMFFASGSFGQIGLQSSAPQGISVNPPAEKCASQLIHEQRLATDPVYALNHHQAEDYIAAHQFEKVGGQYRVPVVVHVVYYNSGLGLALYNITDDQIRNAIKKLNRQNRNLTGSPSVDVDIEYSLAVRDPSGNCTTGITRDNAQVLMSASVYSNYVTNGVRAASTNGILDADIKAINQWSATNYLNIWLVPEFDNSNGGAGVQGYAALAGSHGQSYDGSVMLGIDFIDETSTTLVHELGHSFNLYHTFQGDDGNNDGTADQCPSDITCGSSGDCCADTPRHQRSASTCNASGTNSCTGGSNSLFVYNYMDYSSCPDRFTANQVSRMQTTAGGTRVSFQASSGNNKLVPPVGGATVTAVRAERTTVCLGSTIQLFDATSCSPNDYLDQATSFPGFTYSWTVTNGTNTYTSTHQNPVFTPAAGTYNVTFTMTHASFGTITSTTNAVFKVIASAPVSACSPTSLNTGNFGNTVSRVKFNTIDNNTSVLSTDGYQNFMCTYSTSIAAGSTNPLTVNLNSGGYTEYVEVDIDWNNDGDFADANENAVLSGNIAAGSSTTITQNVVTPAAAVTGVILRMRVMGEYNAAPSAAKQTCSSSYVLGDIEDYGIYVIPAAVCPTVASQPSASTICANTNTSFTASFNNTPTSFQWQVSTNSGSTWTNLSNTAPYSNVTTATLNITAATTAITTYQYRCVGTNSCGSVNSNGAILTVNAAPSAPTITAGGPTTFCTGGSVTLTSSAATGNTWSTGATTQTITVSTAGTYTVTRTVSGCVSAASSGTTITVNAIPSTPTITAGGSTTFCSGGSVTLTSSAGSGNTWSTGATTPSITVTTAGTYTVTATSSGCTSSASAGTTVTVNALPTAPTITAGGSTTFCSGGSVTLTSSAGSGNTWSTGSTSTSITATTSGSYTVTRTVSGCTSPASTPVVVTVNPLPSAPTITAGGSTTFCSGGSVTLTSSAGSGNTWSNGATTPSITVSTAGTYMVTATSLGCTSPASAGTTVTVNAIPTAPTISAGGSTTFCSGGSVTLTSSAGSGNTWSTGSTSTSITATTSGSYTVTRTVSGCTSPASTPVVVTVNPLPSAPTITAGGSTTFCSGGSVTLTSSAGSGNTWSNGATTPSITVSTAGTYTVTATSSGCTSPASAGTTVTVNAMPTAPTITAGGSTTFCSGGSVTLTSSAGSGNTWSTGSTSTSITATTSGSYTVTRTVSGCTSPASTPVVVTVNPLPSAPTITAGGSTTFCSGGSVTLTSSSGSGNTWSNGATTPSITVSTAGTYTVTATSSGCTSPASAGTTVTVNAMPTAPTITAGGSTTFCSGGSVTLTSSAGSGNTWSNGATTPSITVSTAGTYMVTATSLGCTSPASAGTTVTVNAIPTAPTISAGGSTTFCSGGSVTLTSSSGSGNTWSNGATTPSITVSTGGTYTVTTTTSGCTSPASAGTLVTVNATPTAPTISAGGPTTFCSGGSVTLTSSAGSGNTWSDGSTSPSITVSTGGTYTVTTTTSGCTSPASAGTLVTVNPIPAITAGTLTDPSSCGATDGSIAIGGSGSGTLNWSGTNSGTSNVTLPSSISSLVGGTYNITFTPASGCVSNTLNTTLTSPGAPSAPAITTSGSTTICQGGSVVLTSSAGSGNTWSDGSTNPSITVTIAGTYTVTVTSGSCTSSASVPVTVIVNTPVTPNFNAVGPYCSGSSIGALPTTSLNGITGSWTPAINNTATTTYTFTPGSGQCANTGSTSITVNPLPAVSFGSVPQLCVYNSPVTLTQGSPAGGTYSGPGVSGSQFDPAVAGLGTATLIYSFTDNNGCTNTAQSLAVVDACLGLNELTNNSIVIYPNPTSGMITINADQLTIEQVKVYDAFGKLVYEQKANQSIIENIDLTAASSGVYTISVFTNADVKHIPVVINK